LGLVKICGCGVTKPACHKADPRFESWRVTL
jgi:hypothetical protein